MFDQYFEKFDLAPEVTAALKKCKCFAYAETKEELEEMAYGPTHTSRPPTSRALRTALATSFRPFVRRRSTGSPRSRSSCCRFPPVRAATVIRA